MNADCREILLNKCSTVLLHLTGVLGFSENELSSLQWTKGHIFMHTTNQYN